MKQVHSGADADSTAGNAATKAARRLGRYLLYNGLLFDFGAWAYAWMTDNPIWQANCGRLLAQHSAMAAIQVLDLGAGPGNSALAMGERCPAARFIAFDLAQQMVEKASVNRARAGWPLDRLAPVRGDALHLPLADSSVDGVTGHSFLYLLPNYKGVLDEAYRVLRPRWRASLSGTPRWAGGLALVGGARFGAAARFDYTMAFLQLAAPPLLANAFAGRTGSRWLSTDTNGGNPWRIWHLWTRPKALAIGRLYATSSFIYACIFRSCWHQFSCGDIFWRTDSPI